MQFRCISAPKMSIFAEWRSTVRYVAKVWHNEALVGQKFGCKEKVKDLENAQNEKSLVYGRSVSTVQKGPGK